VVAPRQQAAKGVHGEEEGCEVEDEERGLEGEVMSLFEFGAVGAVDGTGSVWAMTGLLGWFGGLGEMRW